MNDPRGFREKGRVSSSPMSGGVPFVVSPKTPFVPSRSAPQFGPTTMPVRTARANFFVEKRCNLKTY
jgi:hypothetical protein